jgi:hypothetical protein
MQDAGGHGGFHLFDGCKYLEPSMQKFYIYRQSFPFLAINAQIEVAVTLDPAFARP